LFRGTKKGECSKRFQKKRVSDVKVSRTRRAQKTKDIKSGFGREGVAWIVKRKASDVRPRKKKKRKRGKSVRKEAASLPREIDLRGKTCCDRPFETSTERERSDLD